jgi:hypothetical protein
MKYKHMRYPGYGAGRRGHLRVFLKKKKLHVVQAVVGKKVWFVAISFNRFWS